MSEPIDFAGVLSSTLADLPGTVGLINRLRSTSDALLAAKVVALCPDCHGVGSWPVKPGGVACGHENAPTIGSMLAERQALTALVEYAQHHLECGFGQARGPITCDCGLDTARAALEETRNPK